MHILVTGLDGFTGRHIQYQLESDGHTVIGLTSDLTDLISLAAEIGQVQPDAVIHLAGISFVDYANANALYEVNLIGTRNLLEALEANVPNVKSILIVSSANVYGNNSGDALSEDVIPYPANDYAVSKLAMEYMAKLWLGRLPLFIVRPFNYTGIGQNEKFLIPKIVAHFRDRKETIELGNLDVWREFGDVRSVASVYTTLLKICPVGQTLNVCTSKMYSLREVIACCENIMGHNIELRVNPEFIRSNEVKVLSGNNSRLNKIIGDWQLYSLEDTLRWMLQSKTIITK